MGNGEPIYNAAKGEWTAQTCNARIKVNICCLHFTSGFCKSSHASSRFIQMENSIPGTCHVTGFTVQTNTQERKGGRERKQE
jgi:hypothetical protein